MGCGSPVPRKAKFRGGSGELRAVKKGGTTPISVDGNGKADFSIALATMNMKEADFIL